MLPDAERAKIDEVYAARALSTSLFTTHFGLNVHPSTIGLDRYGLMVMPESSTSMRQYGEGARLMAHDPADRLPSYGLVNYGAIDSGLAGDGPILVSATGLDRLDNWAALTPQEEKDRRERWLDAFQAALDRDYPGFSAAVVERMFLNARSMANFMNTPGGAIYGFAPLPFERRVWGVERYSARTPLPSVYLASSFTGGFGFSGAMRSGAVAAKMAMKERAR
jgi:phytoene dehydrogenase-like protein